MLHLPPCQPQLCKVRTLLIIQKTKLPQNQPCLARDYHNEKDGNDGNGDDSHGKDHDWQNGRLSYHIDIVLV